MAQRGDLVVIVEVRTRGGGSFASALASVSVTKRRALLRASERLWRTRLAFDHAVQRVRIDVAAVSFDDGVTRVEHIPGAVVGALDEGSPVRPGRTRPRRVRGAG